MKNNLLALAFVIVLLFSCNSRSESNFNLESIPSDWVNLTETDSGLIIFNSCNAGNLLIKVKGDSEIIMYGVQEDYEFAIDKVRNSSDTAILDVHWKGTTDKERFKFHWDNKSKQVGKWQLLNSTVFGYFVSNEKSKEHIVYDQPCIECWPEEECE